MRRRQTLGLLLTTLLWALVVHAQTPTDAPHWTNQRFTVNCNDQCHTLHQSPDLTQADSNVALCQSCHTASGLAGDFPLNTTDRATPGERGRSHGFNVATDNAAYGAQHPLNTDMELRTPLVDGTETLVCSTCHNQHKAEASFGGDARIAPAVQTTALGSTGSISSGGAYTGTAGVWYLIDITVAGNENNADFRYSKDNGTSWFAAQNCGVDVILDNGVTITCGAGSYVVGERWEFSASYPFLRATLDDGNNSSGIDFCRDCHRSWTMTHTEVETWDGNPKSHPVGVRLNENGKDYDRAVPLDGNGAEQGSGGADSNASNDFRLYNDGTNDLVMCLSCHGVHYTDSNTLTEDVP